MTARRLNRRIQDTQGCCYIEGSILGLDHNPRVSRFRCKGDRLQARTTLADGWVQINPVVEHHLIDGRTGRAA